MGRFYDQANIPAELRRNYDVYERIRQLGINLGTFEDNVGSLRGANIASVCFTEAGLVYLSGIGTGQLPMIEEESIIRHGQEAGREAADFHIRTLHWALVCGKEGGDLNDVLYTVKALGMVVSPGGGTFGRAPQVVNGYSARWQSVFGGPIGEFAVDGIDPGGFSGVHARSALGGFDGRFSQEPEIIVAIPQALAQAIIAHRGWLFPLPPAMLEKVRRLWT
ncbi:MAG: hypothetical protein NZ959_11190 [Armatimonadetes bacterium]|nr:hypothetical protein [Armatimonadota bacterium]MDW8122525.1 hypothetical protein [Armatimonadota bacterium]